MKKVILKDKKFKTFIPYEKISAAIDNVAEKINNDFRGCEDFPVLLCVLNGSIMFMAELMKRLDFNCQIISIKLSSYQGTNTTGNVKQTMGLTSDITGRRVIIVEDIVDSGNTVEELIKIMKEKGASDARICTMLFKPEAYTKNFELDYVAMEIPNDFIIGFGLDYDEYGRNLKDIYILDTDSE
jgi:hypoxanthine phosphoribosyltransferase